MRSKTTALLLTIGFAACGDDPATSDATSATTSATDATIVDMDAPDDVPVASDTSDTSVADTTVDGTEVTLPAPDLSCVAAPVQTVLPLATQITVVVTNAVNGEAEPASIALCAAGDVACDPPLQVVDGDANGQGLLTYDPVEGSTSPFIQVSADGLVTTHYLANPGLRFGDIRQIDVHVFEVEQLAAHEVTAGHAHVLARALDCAGAYSPSSALALDTSGTTTKTIDLDGRVGFFDVPVGDVVNVTASYAGQAFGSYAFRPAADVVFELDVRPGPVTTTTMGPFGTVELLESDAHAAFAREVRVVRFANAPSCILATGVTAEAYVDAGKVMLGGAGIEPDQTLHLDACSHEYGNDLALASSDASTVVVEGSGAEVPAFNATTIATSLPGSVFVASPLVDEELGVFVFRAGEPIDLTWEPAASGESAVQVTFRLSVGASFEPDAHLYCAFPIVDGHGIVPANVTEQLALRIGAEGFGTARLSAGGFARVDVDGGSYVIEAARRDSTTSPGAEAMLRSDLVPPPPATIVVPEPSGPAAPGIVRGLAMNAASRGGLFEDVAVNDDGSVIAVGSFSGQMTFGDDDFEALVTDGVVVKLSAEGLPVWAVQIPADGSSVSDVAVVPDGSIYIVGRFSGTLRLTTPGIAALGGSDFFIAKLDANGALKWVRTGGSTDYDAASGLVATAAGAYVLGRSRGDLVFDDQLATVGALEDVAFVARYDSSGAIEWLTTVGDGEAVALSAIDLALYQGRLVVLGSFTGPLPVGQSLLDAPCDVDAFWVAVGLDGSLGQARAFATRGSDDPRAIAAAGEHLVIATSTFGAGTFEGSPVPAGTGAQAVLAQISLEGLPRIAVVDGPGNESADAAAATSDGGMLAAGRFGSQAPTFVTLGRDEPNETVLVSDSSDFYIARWDANGLLWARSLAGADGESVTAVALGPNDTVVAAGSFYGRMRFDADHELVAPYIEQPAAFVAIYR